MHCTASNAVLQTTGSWFGIGPNPFNGVWFLWRLYPKNRFEREDNIFWINDLKVKIRLPTKNMQSELIWHFNFPYTLISGAHAKNFPGDEDCFILLP